MTKDIFDPFTDFLGSYDSHLDDYKSLESLDLTKKEDLDKFMSTVDYLKNSSWNPIFKVFAGDDYAEKVKDFAQSVYDIAHKDDEPTPHKDDELPQRPSAKLPTEAGLQIHKLVDEYVNTMIRPYAHTMTDNQINDVYAGLYEFAAWIYNK